MVSASFCGIPAALPTHDFIQPAPSHTPFLFFNPLLKPLQWTTLPPRWPCMDCTISLYLSRIFTFVLRQRWLLPSSPSRGLVTASSLEIHSFPQGLWSTSQTEAPTCACTCWVTDTPQDWWLWPVEDKDSKAPSFWALLHLSSCYKWKREAHSTCRPCSCHYNIMEEGNPDTPAPWLPMPGTDSQWHHHSAIDIRQHQFLTLKLLQTVNVVLSRK